jgi:hypothetical protein
MRIPVGRIDVVTHLVMTLRQRVAHSTAFTIRLTVRHVVWPNNDANG